MKLLKVILLLVFIGVIALFSAPYWASCGVNYQLCELRCEIMHYGSDLDQASCKATCLAERVACAGSELTAPITD